MVVEFSVWYSLMVSTRHSSSYCCGTVGQNILSIFPHCLVLLVIGVVLLVSLADGTIGAALAEETIGAALADPALGHHAEPG